MTSPCASPGASRCNSAGRAPPQRPSNRRMNERVSGVESVEIEIVRLPHGQDLELPDYRGEVGVILINLGKEPFRITRGMRIAQLVVARHARAVWREGGELGQTARGAGGFGSTGVTVGSAKNA